MDCLLETVASIWMLSVRTVAKPPTEEETCVQENLEGCRGRLEERETELVDECRRLGREAQRRKQLGDIMGAKGKMLERRRGLKRLEKLRSSLSLVDAQLDALRSTELDKELMQTLLASSAALKKAGVGKGVKEAEAVMSELDEQLRESGELTSVLASGVQEEPDFDLDEEFELFEQECELLGGVMNTNTSTVSNSPMVVNKQAEGQRQANVIAVNPTDVNLDLPSVSQSAHRSVMIPDF
jgi:hypothetical protein